MSGDCAAVPRLFREPFILPGAGEAELLAANALRGTRPLSVGAKVLAASIEEIGELAAGARRSREQDASSPNREYGILLASASTRSALPRRPRAHVSAWTLWCSTGESCTHDAHDEKIKLQCRCLLHPQHSSQSKDSIYSQLTQRGLVGHGESLGGRLNYRLVSEYFGLRVPVQ